jgi:hypothetical protein
MKRRRGGSIEQNKEQQRWKCVYKLRGERERNFSHAAADKRLMIDRLRVGERLEK